MTSTSYGVLIGSIAVGLFLATHAYPAEPTDNLFLEIAGGGKELPGDDATAFGNVGFNWGIPVNHESAPDEVGVGLQVGADFTLREENPEGGVTLGLFARRLPSFGEQQLAVAALFDYYRTVHHSDVWAFRPVIGTTISEQDAVGITGSVSLHDDHRAGHCEEALEHVMAFWTREWSPVLATELDAGMQGSHVDQGVFGAHVVYALNEFWDVTLSGEVNTDAAYTTGLRFSYHFGGLSRHDSIHNVRGEGTGRFTPWPRRRGSVVACGGGDGSFTTTGGGPTD